MPVGDKDKVIEIVSAAAKQLTLRCIFSLGRPAGIDEHDPDIFHVGSVDHSWLLPRCVAAVHHGGAGTTAATLRAGIPSVIYAFTAEQPFWARRVSALGLGVGRRFREFGDDHVRSDLGVVLDPSTRAAATEFAATMISPQAAVSAAADIVAETLAARELSALP